MPSVGEALPAGAHRTRGPQVVPRAIHAGEPCTHDAGVRVEVVPLSPVAQPATDKRSGGSQEEPVGAVAKPAGGHVATVVEVVAAAPDPHPLGGGVGTVGSPPPPAGRIAHPRAPSGLIGCVHRRRLVGLRRGRGLSVLATRTGGGGLGCIRGLGAGRGRRRGLRDGLGRSGALRCGLRRSLVPGLGAGLRGQGDEREGQDGGEGARVRAAGERGRRCHDSALSLENSSPISVGHPSHCAGAFRPPTQSQQQGPGGRSLRWAPASNVDASVSPRSRARRPAGLACARGARSRRRLAWARRAWGARASGP